MPVLHGIVAEEKSNNHGGTQRKKMTVTVGNIITYIYFF